LYYKVLFMWQTVNTGISDRNPANDTAPVIQALLCALSAVCEGHDLSDGVKIVITEDGRLSLTRRNCQTGVPETTLYKLRKNGPPLRWSEAKSTVLLNQEL
jgi:hypothetical protein